MVAVKGMLEYEYDHSISEAVLFRTGLRTEVG